VGESGFEFDGDIREYERITTTMKVLIIEDELLVAKDL